MAVKNKQLVHLTSEQRDQLERMNRAGTHTARSLLHARILLLADDSEARPAPPDTAIARAVGVHVNTVARVRKLFAGQGLDKAVHRRKPTGRLFRKLDGEQEARLVAVACSPAPEGHARWTLKLLAGKLVELEVVPSIDPATVCRALKKTTSSPG